MNTSLRDLHTIVEHDFQIQLLKHKEYRGGILCVFLMCEENQVSAHKARLNFKVILRILGSKNFNVY